MERKYSLKSRVVGDEDEEKNWIDAWFISVRFQISVLELASVIDRWYVIIGLCSVIELNSVSIQTSFFFPIKTVNEWIYLSSYLFILFLPVLRTISYSCRNNNLLSHSWIFFCFSEITAKNGSVNLNW